MITLCISCLCSFWTEMPSGNSIEVGTIPVEADLWHPYTWEMGHHLCVRKNAFRYRTDMYFIQICPLDQWEPRLLQEMVYMPLLPKRETQCLSITKPAVAQQGWWRDSALVAVGFPADDGKDLQNVIQLNIVKNFSSKLQLMTRIRLTEI